jgi:hypothetical protein
MEFGTLNGHTPYVITYKASPDRFITFLPFAERIIESFRITGSSATNMTGTNMTAGNLTSAITHTGPSSTNTQTNTFHICLFTSPMCCPLLSLLVVLVDVDDWFMSICPCARCINSTTVSTAKNARPTMSITHKNMGAPKNMEVILAASYLDYRTKKSTSRLKSWYTKNFDG